MATKRNTPERIVAAATDLFLRYGYSRVTIDEIAQELAMSKKTIYNHFGNKSEILLACIDTFAGNYQREIDAILRDVDLSLRQKLNQCLQRTAVIFNGVTINFKEDIKRNEPAAWLKYNAYLRDITFNQLSQLIKEGVRVGYLRDEGDGDLGLLVYIAVIQQLNDPDFLAQFASVRPTGLDDKQLADRIAELLFRGLLSPTFNG